MHALVRTATDLRFVMTTPKACAARAVAFYEALGFEVAADTRLLDDSRWIEMVASGATRGAAVVTPRAWSTSDVTSGFLVASRDVAALERALTAAGVAVCTDDDEDDPELAETCFWFEDPLGNVLFVSASCR
jgi:hypothetical protein